MQFGSTSSFQNSDPAAAASGNESEDVDTVGWGMTTVGTILRAKVGSERFLDHFESFAFLSISLCAVVSPLCSGAVSLFLSPFLGEGWKGGGGWLCIEN